MKNKLLKKGQSLFELMLAVVVVSITLVAMISLVGSTISNTAFSRDRTQAARFTNEAVEWLRSERDLSWTNLTSRASLTGSTYCLNSLSFDSQGTCSTGGTISGTKFTRTLTLVYDETNSPSEISVEVITTWSDSGGSHDSRILTTLTNWRTR